MGFVPDSLDDIPNGTLPAARVTGLGGAAGLPVGTTAGTVAAGDDPRIVGAAKALIPTAVKTANYTLAASDFVPADVSGGSVVLTLPSAPADRTRVGVKVIAKSGANVVTINCAGSDVFNKSGGVTTATLSLLSQAIQLQYATSGAIWYVVADDLPLSQLDLRYPLAANNLSDLASAATARANLGLGALLRTQGWSVVSTAGGNVSGTGILRTAPVAYGQATWNMRGLTYQQPELSPVAVPQIKFVHANWCNTGTTAGAVTSEGSPYGDVTLKASAVDLVNSYFFQARWAGERNKRLASFGITVSDPINLQVAAGVAYGARTCMLAASMDQAIVCSTSNQNVATGGQNLFPLAGLLPDDATFSGTTTGGLLANSANVPCHQMVLGYTGNAPAKSVALLLDSIMQGLGDVFGPGLSGGFGMRFCQNQFNFNVTAANTGTPLYGVTNLSKQGDAQLNFLKGNQHGGRLTLIGMHTNCLDNGGINDVLGLSASAATLQSQTLQMASLVTGLGVRYIKTTLTPTSSSSDGFQTAANQTASNLSVRTTYNTWLRDGSASGFVAQAIAAGCPAGLVGVADIAAAVEVNSSNVLTPNGGLWLAPTGAALYTGSVTTGGSTTGFTDTGLTATANLYRGCAVVITSGTNSGATTSVAGISAMTSAGVLSFNRGFGNAFVIGNTYKIFGTAGVTSQDGVHPSTYGHILMGQALSSLTLV